MELTVTGLVFLRAEEMEQEFYQHFSQSTETYPKPAIITLFHLLKASYQDFIMASINSDKNIECITTYKMILT